MRPILSPDSTTTMTTTTTTTSTGRVLSGAGPVPYRGGPPAARYPPAICHLHGGFGNHSRWPDDQRDDRGVYEENSSVLKGYASVYNIRRLINSSCKISKKKNPAPSRGALAGRYGVLIYVYRWSATTFALQTVLLMCLHSHDTGSAGPSALKYSRGTGLVHRTVRVFIRRIVIIVIIIIIINFFFLYYFFYCCRFTIATIRQRAHARDIVAPPAPYEKHG